MEYFNIRNLTVSFGGVNALSNFEMTVGEGQIRGLIGPNGAGKTTVLNVISGIYKANNGSILYGGKELIGKRPDEIAALGISRTFQNIELFSSMSVLDNVMLGCHIHLKTNLFNECLRTKQMQTNEEQGRQECLKILEFLSLTELQDENASNLSFGQQRLLEIARALAMRPKLVLLDEPAAGMNAEEINRLNTILRKVRDQRGVTMLLIEHVMALIMEISDLITVLDSGVKIAEGKPVEIQNDPNVIEAYLGRED